MKTYSTFLFDLDGTLITTRDLIIACFKFSLGTLGLSYTEAELARHIGLPLVEQFKHFIAMTEAIELRNPWNAFLMRQSQYLGGWVKHLQHQLGLIKQTVTPPLILTPHDLKGLAKRHMDYQKIIWQEHVHIFTGVKAVLKQLQRQGKRLGVVTSRYKETTSLYMKAVGLVDFFDVVITPEDTHLHKPHGAPILKGLERLRDLKLHTTLLKPQALAETGTVAKGENASNLEAETLRQTLYIGDTVTDGKAAEAAGVDFYYVNWEAELKEAKAQEQKNLIDPLTGHGTLPYPSAVRDFAVTYEEHDFKKLLRLA